MKTIIYFTRLGIDLFGGRFKLLSFQKKKKNYEKRNYLNILYKEIQSYTKKIVDRTGSNVTIIGKENIICDRAVVFAPNHQSFFDIPCLINSINSPVAFIAKKDLLKLPVISTAMKEFNCLTLDRENVKEAAKTVIDAINLLKWGQSIVVFPEGTRSHDGVVSEFKSGAFKIATKPKVPIIPVSIKGTLKVFEGNNHKIKPNNITITFHEPIYTENLTKEEIKELPKKVQEIVSKEVN